MCVCVCEILNDQLERFLPREKRWMHRSIYSCVKGCEAGNQKLPDVAYYLLTPCRVIFGVRS